MQRNVEMSAAKAGGVELQWCRTLLLVDGKMRAGHRLLDRKQVRSHSNNSFEGRPAGSADSASHQPVNPTVKEWTTMISVSLGTVTLTHNDMNTQMYESKGPRWQRGVQAGAANGSFYIRLEWLTMKTWIPINILSRWLRTTHMRSFNGASQRVKDDPGWLWFPNIEVSRCQKFKLQDFLNLSDETSLAVSEQEIVYQKRQTQLK